MNLEKFKNKRLAVLLVVIPMLVAVVYYTFFSLNRYVSIAQVVVRQAGSSDAPQLPGLAVMLGTSNPTSREETLYLREYILSNDMLSVVQEKLSWSQHYVGKWQDPIYWLREGTAREELLEYYRRMVSAHFDEQTGLLAVEVQAFDPDFAEETLKVILTESERFVNELSHRMAREQMTFAQGELKKAREEYEQRKKSMLEFQSSSNLLDAEAAAKARAEMISQLEGELTRERAILKSLQARLAENTPQIRQQSTRIRALEQQLQVESRRLVSEQSGEKLNVIAARHRSLGIDAAIAEESYKMAVSAVETARIEANKKLRSLVTVVSPNLPDKAIYPERIYNLLTLLVALLLFYGIARFVISAIEDHRD